MLARNMYKKYLAKCAEAERRIETDIDGFNANSRASCLTGIIRLFNSSEWRHKDSEDLFLLTSYHAKFYSACSLIRERVSDIPANEMSSWSIIYVICVLCEDAWAIYDFMVHISEGDHLLPVLDMLYYLATVLLYLRRKHLIPARLHYNVLHAFDLHENTPNPNICASNPTYEQLQLIEHRLEPDQVVKVIGFAGTGKTTTLAHYAAAHSDKHFLLVVFRKKSTSRIRFPSNVTVRTIHSLAFYAAGNKYSERTKRREFGITEILQTDVLPERSPLNRMQQYQRAKIVDQTIKNFLGSSDPFITAEHIPKMNELNEDTSGSNIDEGHEPRPISIHSLVPEEVIEDAELIWRIMKDPNDHRFPMCHDGYLKEWQLSAPQLPFPNIMVDEAEDFSDAMMDIILKQSCPRIVAGDPHQHIYPFRAEHSPFDALVATHTYFLTRSFHFGPAIGFVANSCLEALKRVKEHFLVGCEIRDSLVNHGEDLLVVNPSSRIAVLARTRTQLFKDIIQTFCNEQGLLRPEKRDRKIGMIDVKKCRKTHHFATDPTFSSSPFLHWSSIPVLPMTKKMKGIIALVQWANHRLPNCLDSIRQMIRPYEDADIVYGTVHDAKSMNWETVILLDDFPYAQIPHTPLASLCGASQGFSNDKDFNILYTAATRATRNLVLNSALFLVLAAVQEKMERVVSTCDYLDRFPGAKCKKCNVLLPSSPPGNTLLLEVVAIRVCNDLVDSGALCSCCSAQAFYVRPPSLSPRKGQVPEKPRTDFAHQTYAGWIGPLTDEERLLANEKNNFWKDYYLRISVLKVIKWV